MERDTEFNESALNLDRCPHCSVANPLLKEAHSFSSVDSSKMVQRNWKVYICSKCGGAVLGACYPQLSPYIVEIFPQPEALDEGMPEKAHAFLQQAVECLHSPSGAIMLCASSVDAMLKTKDLRKGSLYSRIEKAAEQALITKEMALWAHEVRLDANDERHADDEAELPTLKDAERCVEFTKALGMFLFVLPNMVEQGREKAKNPA